MGGAVESIVEPVVDVVEDAGSWIDDNVIQPVLDDPIETAATVAAYYVGGPIAAGATKTAFALEEGKDLDQALKEGATTAAVAYAGSELLGPGTTGGETGAFDIAGNPDILGGSSAQALGNIGAGAFDVGGNPDVMAMPNPAPITTLDVLPGQGGGFDMAGNPDILGGSSSQALWNTTSPTQLAQSAYSIGNELMGGVAKNPLQAMNLVGGLMSPTQPRVNPYNQQAATTQAQGVDYSGLLSLLQQRAQAPGLLGTQFQPQSINLTSLLG